MTKDSVTKNINSLVVSATDDVIEYVQDGVLNIIDFFSVVDSGGQALLREKRISDLSLLVLKIWGIKDLECRVRNRRNTAE